MNYICWHGLGLTFFFFFFFFFLKLQTTGALEPEDIVIRALKVLQRKLNRIRVETEKVVTEGEDVAYDQAYPTGQY